MAETIRDVVVRLQLQQAESKVKAPNLDPAKKEVDKFAKAVENFGTIIEDSNKKAQEGTKKTEDAHAKSSEAIRAANIQLLDSFGQVGEGTLKMARGFVLLGIAAEDDLRKVAEQLAKVQGAIDIFTGGVAAVKGMVSAQKALALATTASATATTGLVATMAPFAPILVGVGAAVGVLAIGYSAFGEEAAIAGDKAAEAQRKVSEEISKSVQLIRDLRSIKQNAADEELKFASKQDQLTSLRAREAALREKQRGTVADIESIGQVGGIQPQFRGLFVQQAARQGTRLKEITASRITLEREASREQQSDIARRVQAATSAASSEESAAAKFGALSRQEQFDARALGADSITSEARDELARLLTEQQDFIQAQTQANRTQAELYRQTTNETLRFESKLIRIQESQQ